MNEKEIHNSIQKLRKDYGDYFAGLESSVSDDDLWKLRTYATNVNNKFVELLILNELIHKLNMGGNKNV